MRGPRLSVLIVSMTAIVSAVAISACGSSSSSSAAQASGNPRTLLKQTFSASHNVKSGVLDVHFVVTPTGSSIISTPVSLDFSGPFQSRVGSAPAESNFTISFSGLGKSGSFGVISTAKAAYIRIQGVAYQLPRSDVKKLQSNLTGNSSTGSAPGLASLGINPANWLTNPTIVGTETVDGAPTTHLRAGVDVTALVADFDKLLAKESSTTAKAGLPTHISTSAASKVAAALHGLSVDLWTGKSDSTLRRLTLGATVPVIGSTSTQLGGMTSAAFSFSLDYAHLNQAETIAAPANAHSYVQLQAKLKSLGSQLQSSFGTGSTGTGSTGSGSTGSGSTGSAGQVSDYTKCINGAGGNVRKMQKCASLLNAAGG